MSPRSGVWAVWALVAIACDRSPPPAPVELPFEASTLSGTVRASGSSALQPLLNLAKERFERLHPEVNIEIAGGGSKKGLVDVASGAVDLGSSDIPAPPDLAQRLHDHPVAILVYAPMAHRGPATEGISALSLEQLQAIYGGQITRWSELGGADRPIVVINRGAGSGTRQVFADRVMDGRPFVETQTEDNSGALVAKLIRTPGAISYLSLAFEAEALQTISLRIDGQVVSPTPRAVRDGQWPLTAVAHVYTLGEPSPLAAAFLAFLRSAELEAPIAALGGFLPLREQAQAELSP